MLDLITLPNSMTGLVFTSLVLLSFFTSMLSASMGIGGGTILLAVMAQVVPVKAIIPVHGMVQLGSNVGRALVLLPNVRWLYLFWFLLVFPIPLIGQRTLSYHFFEMLNYFSIYKAA